MWYLETRNAVYNAGYVVIIILVWCYFLHNNLVQVLEVKLISISKHGVKKYMVFQVPDSSWLCNLDVPVKIM